MRQKRRRNLYPSVVFWVPQRVAEAVLFRAEQTHRTVSGYLRDVMLHEAADHWLSGYADNWYLDESGGRTIVRAYMKRAALVLIDARVRGLQYSRCEYVCRCVAADANEARLPVSVPQLFPRKSARITSTQ